jgi:hypothetical protein
MRLIVIFSLPSYVSGTHFAVHARVYIPRAESRTALRRLAPMLGMQRSDLFLSCGPYMGGVVMGQYEDLLIDALLDSGFTLEEACRLIALQERYEEEHPWQLEKRQLAEWIDLMGGNDCLN